MNKHRGQTVEYIVRRNSVSITQLAYQLGVNRRTIYNWFQMALMPVESISNIGEIISHDFSNEFPELSEWINRDKSPLADGNFNCSMKHTNYWKEKYIQLLEEYNTNLIDRLNSKLQQN